MGKLVGEGISNTVSQNLFNNPIIEYFHFFSHPSRLTWGLNSTFLSYHAKAIACRVVPMLIGGVGNGIPTHNM